MITTDRNIKYTYIVDTIYLSQFVDQDELPKFKYSKEGICKLFNDLNSVIYAFNNLNNGYDEIEPMFELDAGRICSIANNIYDYIFSVKRYSERDEYVFIIRELLNIFTNIVLDYTMISKYCYNSMVLYDIIKKYTDRVINDLMNDSMIEILSTNILLLKDRIDKIDITNDNNSILINYKSFLIDKRNELLN